LVLDRIVEIWHLIFEHSVRQLFGCEARYHTDMLWGI